MNRNVTPASKKEEWPLLQQIGNHLGDDNSSTDNDTAETMNQELQHPHMTNGNECRDKEKQETVRGGVSEWYDVKQETFKYVPPSLSPHPRNLNDLGPRNLASRTSKRQCSDGAQVSTNMVHGMESVRSAQREERH